jgi:hypothetical protein
MSSIRFIAAVGATIMLWSPNVAAQNTLAVGACITDAKSLCGERGGTGIEPLRGCFRDHVKELSNACLLSLAKLLEVNRADASCGAHINQHCGNVPVGEGRLEACLRTAVDTLSDSCKAAIVRAIPGAR